MSPNQKNLKLASFALMIVALVGIVGGALLFASPALAGAFWVPVDVTVGVPVPVAGAAAVVAGALCLVAGASGARVANSPRDVSGLRALCAVLVVVGLASVLLGVLSGEAPWVSVLIVVLAVAEIVLADRASDEVKDR